MFEIVTIIYTNIIHIYKEKKRKTVINCSVLPLPCSHPYAVPAWEDLTSIPRIHSLRKHAVGDKVVFLGVYPL